MRNKTIGFFVASITCIALSIIVASQITQLTRKENLAVSEASTPDAEQIRQHTIDDNIREFHLAELSQTTGKVDHVRLTIRFGDSDEVRLEYLPDAIKTDTLDVDLDKITWETQGDRLTMHLNDALDIGRFHRPKLFVTLPRRDWTIAGIEQLRMRTHIENKGSPISLESDMYALTVSGTFKQLALWRIGSDYCHSCLNIRSATVDTLDVYYGGESGSELVDLNYETKFNAINLHMDKGNIFRVVDLSTLSKIHWFELTEAEKEKLLDKALVDAEKCPSKQGDIVVSCAAGATQ